MFKFGMTTESYLIFVGASLLLAFIPGPDMAYVLGRAVAQGRRAGYLATIGVNAGAYVHLIAAVTGLSALLMTSAVAFTTLKWIGAGYLFYLGVTTLLAKQGEPHEATVLRGATDRAIFWQGFLSDALNPKVALFYLSLLPQFVSPHSQAAWRDLLLLGITANMVGLVVNAGLVLLSSAASSRLRLNAKAGAWLKRALGITFIGLAARVVTERR